MLHRPPFVLRLLAAGLLACWAGTSNAAEVTVKGEDLPGVVVGITSGGLRFETAYGKGAIEIPWADVEQVSSDRSWVVLNGDDGLVRGRLLGIEEGQLLIGSDPATAARIDPGTIHRVFTEEEYADSTWDALRSRYRYWSGDFSLTGGLTQATTDSSNLASDLQIERRKDPTRLLATASYRYSDTKEKGFSRTKNDNAVRGLLRGEYDVSDRTYTYASATAEYDEVQSLSIRTVPKLGVGYRIIRTEKAELNADVGPSYVYERFFGGDTNDYFAIAFGSSCRYEMPWSAKFECRGEYLPAVDEWADNYLLRGLAQLSVPLLEWMSFRFKVEDEYTSQPADDADHNRLTVTAGLGVTF
jgi:putative salt-induced outer membrane protein YdiY